MIPNLKKIEEIEVSYTSVKCLLTTFNDYLNLFHFLNYFF